jgi:coenzyme F420-dependent glucose-6-phosphate dehydrogenase
MLKLGWKAGPEQYPPSELLSYAIAADVAGFDALDVSDHFHPWSEKGQACFTWTWLGAAAVQTKRIELGTGITCPILRYHPSIIAQAAATVASLAPGRTYLGVGTGEALNEYSSTGQWPDYDERQTMLLEAIKLIRALWTGEEVTFDGIYYLTRKAKLYTRPSEAIPIYVSSLVPESAEFAGRHGDGLFTVGGNSPEVYKKMLESFEAGAREAGRDPDKMPRLIELGVAYTDDREAAISSRRGYWAGALIPAMYSQRIYTPKMSERNGSVVGSEIIEQKTLISADPAEHMELANRYIDMGFTHLFFHCAGPDQLEFIKSYGRDVLPKIRRGRS